MGTKIITQPYNSAYDYQIITPRHHITLYKYFTSPGTSSNVRVFTIYTETQNSHNLLGTVHVVEMRV
jgi:hypothetical protein